MSMEARRETGWLLRRLQQGERLTMPESRAMPTIGAGCHELRVTDTELRKEWRVIYSLRAGAIVVLDVFAKTTARTPDAVLATARTRLAKYGKDELP
jgi:phage-related protein